MEMEFFIILPLEQRGIFLILQTFIFAKGQECVYVHLRHDPHHHHQLQRRCWFVKFVYTEWVVSYFSNSSLKVSRRPRGIKKVF